MEWFKRQLFGSKSERRLFDDPKPAADAWREIQRAERSAASEIEVAGHRRRRADGASEAEDEAPALRSVGSGGGDPDPQPRDRGENPEDYEVVGEKVTCRLAQRPGSYVVLRYVRKVYKRKADGVFSCPPAPPAVLEKSCADVSFLAGLLIDKFVYHLPLYRQHQRLRRPGST